MKCAALGLIFMILSFPAFGGVYFASDSSFFEPFIVVHPAGYDGVTGGLIEIGVCIESGSETLRPALEEAIQIWNDMIPSAGNCIACRLVEAGPGGSGVPNAMSTVLLHELGHCGLGLGHINWEDPILGDTSFTNTKDATAIDIGVDEVRGSLDDSPTPLPGSRVVHWFSTTDNDPFVHMGPVDGSNYTRRIIDLPTGHLWPANANAGVGQLLGYMDTQGVMYSFIGVGQSYSGLAADEVNTVQFAMSGMDEMAGTGDDYTIVFSITSCELADVEVVYDDLGSDTGTLGSCLADLDPLPTGGLEVHHVLRPFDTNPRALVRINNAEAFDVLFANGFESGDASGWSLTIP